MKSKEKRMYHNSNNYEKNIQTIVNKIEISEPTKQSLNTTSNK